MAQFIDRVATDWIEIRNSRLQLRKGFVTGTKLRQIEALLKNHEIPAHTSVWLSKNRTVHFKPNFPSELRPQVRDILH